MEHVDTPCTIECNVARRRLPCVLLLHKHETGVVSNRALSNRDRVVSRPVINAQGFEISIGLVKQRLQAFRVVCFDVVGGNYHRYQRSFGRSEGF